MLSTEKRTHEKLLGYWESLKADRPFPLETDVNPDQLKDIWDDCFLVRADDDLDGRVYRYIYLGQSLVNAYGEDGTDKEACEKLVYPINQVLITLFDRVIDTKEAIFEDIEFTNTNGMLIKSRTCFLPLGYDDTQQARYVLGGMKWKAL